MPEASTTRARAAAVGVAVALVLTAGACGGGSFEDRTARVRIDGDAETYEVASCGLDDRTVFVLARAGSGAVLQLVMGVEEDQETAVPRSTGVTVDVSDAVSAPRFAAFGAESWERRGSVGAPPGSIDSARLRGSRIQVSGSMVPVDEADRPVSDAAARPFDVDVRCDLEEG